MTWELKRLYLCDNSAIRKMSSLYSLVKETRASLCASETWKQAELRNSFRDLARQLGLQHCHGNFFKSTGLHVVLPGSKHLHAFGPQPALPWCQQKWWLQAETPWRMLSINVCKITSATNSWVFNGLPLSPSQPMNGLQSVQNKNLNKKWTWKNGLHWLKHFTTGLHNSFSSPPSSVHQRGADTK